MHNKCISSSWGEKSTCSRLEDFPNNEMEGCKISEWEVVIGAPDRVNMPCPMHDNRLCQIYVKMTNNYHGTEKM